MLGAVYFVFARLQRGKRMDLLSRLLLPYEREQEVRMQMYSPKTFPG